MEYAHSADQLYERLVAVVESVTGSKVQKFPEERKMSMTFSNEDYRWPFIFEITEKPLSLSFLVKTHIVVPDERTGDMTMAVAALNEVCSMGRYTFDIKDGRVFHSYQGIIEGMKLSDDYLDKFCQLMLTEMVLATKGLVEVNNGTLSYEQFVDRLSRRMEANNNE